MVIVGHFLSQTCQRLVYSRVQILSFRGSNLRFNSKDHNGSSDRCLLLSCAI